MQKKRVRSVKLEHLVTFSHAKRSNKNKVIQKPLNKTPTQISILSSRLVKLIKHHLNSL